MKSKWRLIAAIVQLVIGIMATISFVIIAVSGDAIIRWIPAFLLAIAYVVIGVIGIIDYKTDK